MLKYHFPHNRDAEEIICFIQMLWENGGGRKILGNYLAKKGMKYYWDRQNLRVQQSWMVVSLAGNTSKCLFYFFPTRDCDPESIEMAK